MAWNLTISGGDPEGGDKDDQEKVLKEYKKFIKNLELNSSVVGASWNSDDLGMILDVRTTT